MMLLSLQHEPTVIMIFGASGDLTRRKVVSALYNLFLDHWLPERFALIGFARTSFTETSFREHLRQGVDQFSRRCKTKEVEKWLLSIRTRSFSSARPAIWRTRRSSLRFKG